MMRRTLSCFVVLLILVAGIFPVFAAGEPEATSTDGPIPVELLEQGWTNVPNDPGNPYETWINENFNIDFTLTNTSEFSSIVLIRFASDDPPDIVSFGGNKTLMETTYDQGVLVEDWNEYMDHIPTIDERYPAAGRKLFTRNGNLITLARHPEINIWSWKLRRDWLDALGLSEPTTPDELLAVGRAFTYDDPDGNGEDDTYGFTSSGGGQSLGEIENFLAMYGPMSFHVADGEVSHPIINGDQEKFYDFLRQMVEEELIEPDWYTQGWAERKPALFSGALGICWYPGVLVNEVEGGTGNTGETLDWWDSFAMPTGEVDGGKLPEPGVHGIVLSVSKNAESNSEKMTRILALMEETTYPNDGFWTIRWGIGIDDFEPIPMEGGYTYINVTGGEQGDHYKGQTGNMGGFDYGTWLNPGRSDLVVAGSVAEPSGGAREEVRLNSQALEMEAYEPQAGLLTLDPAVVQVVLDVKHEFEIRYVLGETDDYAGFQEAWLAAGGQELLDSAEEQFRTLGMLQ